jgi:hypothetical protein
VKPYQSATHRRGIVTLVIGYFELVGELIAHDSKPSLGALNPGRAVDFNAVRAVGG